MHGEKLMKLWVADTILDVPFCPIISLSRLAQMRRKVQAVKVEQPDDGDDFLKLQVQTRSLFYFRKVLVFSLETDRTDSDRLRQPGIKPPLEEFRQRLSFSVAFDKQDELHTIASRSPSQNN